MLTTTQLKEYAQLSQASYAYFGQSDLLNFGGTNEIRTGWSLVVYPKSRGGQTI